MIEFNGIGVVSDARKGIGKASNKPYAMIWLTLSGRDAPLMLLFNDQQADLESQCGQKFGDMKDRDFLWTPVQIQVKGTIGVEQITKVGSKDVDTVPRMQIGQFRVVKAEATKAA